MVKLTDKLNVPVYPAGTKITHATMDGPGVIYHSDIIGCWGSEDESLGGEFCRWGIAKTTGKDVELFPHVIDQDQFVAIETYRNANSR